MRTIQRRETEWDFEPDVPQDDGPRITVRLRPLTAKDWRRINTLATRYTGTMAAVDVAALLNETLLCGVVSVANYAPIKSGTDLVNHGEDDVVAAVFAELRNASTLRGGDEKNCASPSGSCAPPTARVTGIAAPAQTISAPSVDAGGGHMPASDSMHLASAVAPGR